MRACPKVDCFTPEKSCSGLVLRSVFPKARLAATTVAFFRTSRGLLQQNASGDRVSTPQTGFFQREKPPLMASAPAKADFWLQVTAAYPA